MRIHACWHMAHTVMLQQQRVWHMPKKQMQTPEIMHSTVIFNRTSCLTKVSQTSHSC